MNLPAVVDNKEIKRKKVMMPEESRKLLKELYLIRSYSGFEEPIRRGIMAFLDSLKIPYINFNGNILGFNHPGAPLFSAHMDMVNTESYKLKGDEYRLNDEHVFTVDHEACIRLYRGRDNDGKPNQQTSLGADDKNGIWVILSLLQMGKKINFAFCHSEESGGEGSRQIVSDEECAKFIAECAYCIVIDRRNAGDIIGYDNKYCMCLDDRLHVFSDEHKFGYKPTRGSVSDADRFSALVECVNLSCGYYEPHSSREYTNLNELWNTLQFCIKILESFNYQSASEKRMQDFKNTTAPYKKIITTTATTVSSNTTNDVNYFQGTRRSSYGTTGYGYGTNYRTSRKEEPADVKKNLGSTQTTTPMNTATTATGTNKAEEVDVESLLELFNMYNYINPRETLDRAIMEDAFFDSDWDYWMIPLYPEDSITAPKGITSHDAVEWTRCPKCGKYQMILEASVDELVAGNYDIEEQQLLGICTECFEVQDIKGTIAAYTWDRYV